MADIKISQLGEALAVTDNDILPMTASGVTNKVKASTMKSYMVDDLKVSDLYDTTITTPTDDDGLVYNGTSQKWENKQITTKEQWKKNGAYNLCPIDGVTEVKQAVTFTVNSNRTISANGTASGDIYYTVASATFTVDKTGFYKFVGRPSDITGTCNLFVYVAADGGAVLTDSDGTGAIGTLTAGVVYGVSIYVASGVNISNKTFKPLLTTDLNATYYDFVKPAMTNLELTRKCYYKDVTWRFDAASMKEFLRAITYKVAEVLNQESEGSTVTGAAIWSGYDTCGFIGCKDSSSDIYSLMAWRDNYMYTVRYVPNTTFNAYLYPGTAL